MSELKGFIRLREFQMTIKVRHVELLLQARGFPLSLMCEITQSEKFR